MLRKSNLLGTTTILIGLVAVTVSCNRVTTDSADSLESVVAESQPVESQSVQNDREPATVADAPTDEPVTDTDATKAEESLADGSLTVGDEAPSIHIADWVLGSPAGDFEDHIHVVEFWATWCGPCRTSMPHLSQLQTEYAEDVTFIGISREDISTVEAFLNKPQSRDAETTWNEVIKYTIAIDDNDATTAAYMQAAGQTGIPTAFVVGRTGHIEWIGHPMTIDQPLQEIIAGSWDRDAERDRFVRKQAAKQELRNVSQALRTAKSSGDWTAALEVIDSAIAQIPDHNGLKIAKLEVLLNTGEFTMANSLAEGLAEENWEAARDLNAIAWSLVTLSKEEADLELAQRIALRATSLTDDKNPSILDTVARVYFERGEVESAIAWQEKACALAPSNSALSKTLKRYLSLQTPLSVPEE